jgi:hypothetical protein
MPTQLSSLSNNPQISEKGNSRRSGRLYCERIGEHFVVAVMGWEALQQHGYSRLNILWVALWHLTRLCKVHVISVWGLLLYKYCLWIEQQYLAITILSDSRERDLPVEIRTGYHDWWLSSVPTCKHGIVYQIRPRPLPYGFLPAHYEPVFLPFSDM